MSYSVELFIPATSTTVDITAQTLNVQIIKILDAGVTSYTLECRNIDDEYLFNHIIVKKNGSILISGLIVNQNDRWNGSIDEKLTNFTCQDWGYFLPRRAVADSFLSRTTSEILNSLILKYTPEFTRNNIQASSNVIGEARFIYSTLKDAIDYVIDLTPDAHWYIDEDKDFNFFQVFKEDGITLTADKLFAESLAIENEGIESYNKVWVVGIKQPATNAIDVFFDSDGEQRYFGPLTDEPSGLAIFLNPVGLPEFQLNIALESDDDGSSFDMLFNTKRRLFYFPSYKNPTDYIGRIRANFRPVRQAIDFFEDVTNINAFGLMEKVIKNNTVINRLEARKYAREEVKRTAQTKRYLKFESDNADVLDMKLGQRIPVDLQLGAWNIQGNFLVRQLQFSIVDQRLTVSVELEELI